MLEAQGPLFSAFTAPEIVFAESEAWMARNLRFLNRVTEEISILSDIQGLQRELTEAADGKARMYALEKEAKQLPHGPRFWSIVASLLYGVKNEGVQAWYKEHETAWMESYRDPE